MTWIEKNPSFEYALLDDDDVKLYVTAHFGARELEALRRVRGCVSPSKIESLSNTKHSKR